MKYKKTRQILRNLYDQNDYIDLATKKEKYKIYLDKLRKLAYQGNAEAQYDLAQHYEDIGFWGISNPYSNPKKKLYWYTKAANNNHPAAYNNLADMYERGKACNRDIDKALSYYRKSADLGYSLARRNVKTLLKQIKDGYFNE